MLADVIASLILYTALIGILEVQTFAYLMARIVHSGGILVMRGVADFRSACARSHSPVHDCQTRRDACPAVVGHV